MVASKKRRGGRFYTYHMIIARQCWKHASTYNECEDKRADSVANVWCNVVSELLNSRQESLQLVELTLRGAAVAIVCRCRRRRRHGRGARRAGLASRGAR